MHSFYMKDMEEKLIVLGKKIEENEKAADETNKTEAKWLDKPVMKLNMPKLALNNSIGKT